ISNQINKIQFMNIALVTGSAGLIGSESVAFLSDKFDMIVGIDNNLRQYFFGKDGNTEWNRNRIEQQYSNYKHYSADIREVSQLEPIFKGYGSDIQVVVHTAAQLSHDWAAKEPLTDYGVNARGILNVLDAAHLHAPEAVFIFTSTNKVYGDNPNYLHVVELET